VAFSIIVGANFAAGALHPAVGFLVGWGHAFVDATVG
jgi:hypothetical protein